MKKPYDYPGHIRKFLRLVAGELECRLQNGSPNYEEIYHALLQTEKSRNAVVLPFVDILRQAWERSDSLPPPGTGDSTWDFETIVRESKHYIVDLVAQLLNRTPDSLEKLSLIPDACADRDFSSVDVFTLNHDRVLDMVFEQRNLESVDGFGDAINGVRYWQPETYDKLSVRVRLFKLHGAVDWGRYRHDPVGQRLDIVGIRSGSASDQSPRPVDYHPLLLIGTENKPTKYTSGVFSDLHCLFHNSLRSSTNLIVCGYGFGDEGINWKFFEFCYSSPDRIAVVISPNARRILEDPRCTRRHAHIEPLDKCIQETNWPEVKALLDPRGGP